AAGQGGGAAAQRLGRVATRGRPPETGQDLLAQRVDQQGDAALDGEGGLLDPALGVDAVLVVAVGEPVAELVETGARRQQLLVGPTSRPCWMAFRPPSRVFLVGGSFRLPTPFAIWVSAPISSWYLWLCASVLGSVARASCSWVRPAASFRPPTCAWWAPEARRP